MNKMLQQQLDDKWKTIVLRNTIEFETISYSF